MRVEDDYARQGTANLCMVFEALAGQRRVTVTARRTALDVAQVIQALVDAQDPHDEKMVRVLRIAIPTSLRPCMRPVPHRRRGGCWSVWRDMAPRRLAAGERGLRPHSVS